MAKWADYLISEVSYDQNHLIKYAKRHTEVGQTISKGKIVDRLTIASDIKNKLSYVTIHNSLSSWKKGKTINAFRIQGDPFLRIDENKVTLDNLGELPDVNFDNLSPHEIEKIKEYSEKSEPDTEPEVTPEKLQSPRGSLPKDTDEELSQELELAPESEPDTEPEVTPEQISRLDHIKTQIDELEKILSSVPEPSDEEATPEQLSRLDFLEKQIDQLNTANLEKKLIQKLEKENKKLDEIESKLTITKKANLKPKSNNPLEAYCVKCKQKRPISNPKETTMKNGRPAVRGTCFECGTKVFRIIKKK